MHKKKNRVLLALSTVALLLLVSIGGPSLALRALGLKRQGTVGAALAAAPPQDTGQAVGEPLDSITIRCPNDECEVKTVSAQDLEVLELMGGLDDEGRPEYRFVFDEEGFNRFFHAQIEPWLPILRDAPYRNLWFDLRDGGAVARAEIDVNPGWGFSLPSGVPYLGVNFNYGEQGIEIFRVLTLSPADQAGLEIGDVIYELDGVPVEEAPSLIDWTRQHEPGEVVALGVLRDGREMRLELELGEWTDEATWHSVGLVLTPDVTGSRLAPLGFSVEEDLYSLPTEGPLASAIADGERFLDYALGSLTIVGPLEGEAREIQMSFAEDRLIVVVR